MYTALLGVYIARDGLSPVCTGNDSEPVNAYVVGCRCLYEYYIQRSFGRRAMYRRIREIHVACYRVELGGGGGRSNDCADALRGCMSPSCIP